MFKKLFLLLSISFIIFLNIILGISFFLIENFYIKETKNTILSQVNTIKTFLFINKSNQFSIPIYKIQQTNNNLFISISKNPYIFSSKWEIINDKLIYQTNYNWYNIIVGKNLEDFIKFKKYFIKTSIIINIIWLFISFALAYLISKKSLKSLYQIVEKLEKFNFKKPRLINLKSKEKEIQVLTNAINKFINSHKNILQSQKEFIQDVSHQLKTPLMQIQTSLELIENNENKEKIQTIQNSLNNLSKSISDLNFILQNNSSNIKNKKINIKKVIEDTLNEYSDLINKKQIKIEKNINDTFITANIDYIKKLIDNLISNAIFYNKKNGKIKITVNDNQIIIEDSWVGIKKENLDNIFDRFSRFDKNWMYPNWSWLGLSIVKKIVNNYNWKIKVESKEWIWTKFIINFK